MGLILLTNIPMGVEVFPIDQIPYMIGPPPTLGLLPKLANPNKGLKLDRGSSISYVKGETKNCENRSVKGGTKNGENRLVKGGLKLARGS